MKIYNEISWYLHGPTIHKAGLNLIGGGINLFALNRGKDLNWFVKTHILNKSQSCEINFY